jgi:hypothetical protein
MEMSGQPRLCIKSAVYWVGGFVDPRTSMDAGKENIPAPTGKSNTGCPASALTGLSQIMISVLRQR